mmetsp:Transcript_35463/g.89123  ORF Transcript_35463/g.89123 Transcript_35463/m.89123 type:complete len:255 (+) Transcript_35463:761-1525(+)
MVRENEEDASFMPSTTSLAASVIITNNLYLVPSGEPGGRSRFHGRPQSQFLYAPAPNLLVSSVRKMLFFMHTDDSMIDLTMTQWSELGGIICVNLSSSNHQRLSSASILSSGQMKMRTAISNPFFVFEASATRMLKENGMNPALAGSNPVWNFFIPVRIMWVSSASPVGVCCQAFFLSSHSSMWGTASGSPILSAKSSLFLLILFLKSASGVHSLCSFKITSVIFSFVFSTLPRPMRGLARSSRSGNAFTHWMR